jgi:hypothetical protein
MTPPVKRRATFTEAKTMADGGVKIEEVGAMSAPSTTTKTTEDWAAFFWLVDRYKLKVRLAKPPLGRFIKPDGTKWNLTDTEIRELYRQHMRLEGAGV